MDLMKCGQIIVLASLFFNAVESFTPRVVGGEYTPIIYAPFMASLQRKSWYYSSSHHCGAVIVTRKYLLTAAHCICEDPRFKIQPCKMLNPNDFIVRCGSELADGGHRTNVVQFIRHAGYNHVTIENDWGAIKLQNDLPYIPDKIMAAILPPRDYRESSRALEYTLRSKEECVLYGWGNTEPRLSSVLQKVRLHVHPADKCNYLVRSNSDIPFPFNGAKQICAMEEQVVKGSCHGDSGGPLVCRKVVWGLVSWSLGCSRRGIPTVFSRADVARNWLEQIIHEKREASSTSSVRSLHWAVALFVTLIIIYHLSLVAI